jgi:hypothetical protein
MKPQVKSEFLFSVPTVPFVPGRFNQLRNCILCQLTRVPTHTGLPECNSVVLPFLLTMAMELTIKAVFDLNHPLAPSTDLCRCFCPNHEQRVNSLAGCLCIDIDTIFEFIYKKKVTATDHLRKHLSTSDYLYVPQENANEKAKYFLTEDGFKCFLMRSRSPVGEQIRRYYLTLEREYGTLVRSCSITLNTSLQELQSTLQEIEIFSEGAKTLLKEKEEGALAVSAAAAAGEIENRARAAIISASEASDRALARVVEARVAVQAQEDALAAKRVTADIADKLANDAVAECANTRLELQRTVDIHRAQRLGLRELELKFTRDLRHVNRALSIVRYGPQSQSLGTPATPYLVEVPDETRGNLQVVRHIGENSSLLMLVFALTQHGISSVLSFTNS